MKAGVMRPAPPPLLVIVLEYPAAACALRFMSSPARTTAGSSDVGAGVGAEGSSGADDGMLGEAPMHVSGSAGEECLGDVK